MSDTNKHPGFGVTAEDLRRYDWQARLAKLERKECYSFYEAFSQGAKECHEAKDETGNRVFSCLAVVASFHPNYDARVNPYCSMWSGFNGKRSLNAEDLTESDLAALAAIVEEIQDPEYRARVADVLWTTKKNFKAARIAIAAFLESAQRLKTDDLWPLYTERLERASRIAATRGFEQDHKTCVAAVEAAIAEFENNPKSGLLCHRLMSMLLAQGEGDAARYAALSERLAAERAKIVNWDFSEAYWLTAEQWHRLAKNEADAQRCLLSAAECNVSRGEAGLSTMGAMYAAHWLGRGVEALRRGKADAERIKAAHRRFLELEKLSLAEMKPAGIDVDKMPEFRENEKMMQEAAAAHVKGHDIQTALERFANITQPTKLVNLKKQFADATEHTVFDKIIGASSIDHTGKVTDTIPPEGVGNADEEAEALRKKLCQMARTVNWPMQVAWFIEPARIALGAEHPIRRQDLLFLVVNNPFIPQGHEGIYLHGLQAGFFGEWLIATHLLIPQVESSVRYVLQQHGVITSTLESDGTQKERDLNQLLWMPEVENIFGEDMLFDLRGILIERFGHNLRNESAHGLLPEGGFYQPVVVYLWWVILRLCWMGFRLAQQPPPDSTQEEPKP
jgi:hypothetical protein